MAELPSGTVAFLFSDVEGSTRLLTRLRGGYAEVLAEHHRVLRAAFEEYDGCEIGTQGDGFFVAFARASDAIAAAIAAQRGLSSGCWPEGLDVRVRMGVHTGEAELGLDGYVGLDVHRAARICSAAHGGQVLISGATRELIEGALPADVVLKDLGEHRLKDLIRPEHLFQVVAGGLAADFPPPVSLLPMGSWGAGALPPSPNRTIGREADVQAIAARLRVGPVRLVTLTGPGGVGKTRLALEAARAVQADFADGARFVSLAALRQADDVSSAIIQALGIVPISGETPEQAVTRFLSAKHLLLVLDNFEHLLPAAQLVSDLLTACSTLTVLATSREPLALHAEERYPVSPLALRDPRTAEDPDALAGTDAVALFGERARAHDAGFDLGAGNAATVAQICRRLDGLPLAIELAAARCGLLAPGEILERLDARLTALGAGARDAPERQRSLQATIEWSHSLLNAEERACFARFAVFAGGATVDAAERITGTDLETLDHLHAKSLLVRRQTAGAQTRLAMLETIRAYAAERLVDERDQPAVRARHYRHYLELARSHGTDKVLQSTGGKAHLAELDAEIDNFREALRWAVGEASAAPALAMCAALGRYWTIRNRFAEAVEWIDRALSLPGADADPVGRARVLCVRVWCMRWLGLAAEQAAVGAEAETLARRSGDSLLLSQVLQMRAHYEANAGRLGVADALADEALRCALAAGDRWEIATAWGFKATASSTGAELRERVRRAAELLEEVGNAFQLGHLLSSAAYSALLVADDRDAQEFVDRAEPIAHELDDPYMWMVLDGNVGLTALLRGDGDAAARAFREELELCRALVVRPIACEGLLGLAAVAATCDDARRAARLVGAASAHAYGEQQDVIEARLQAAFLEPARERHGGEAWDAAVEEGAQLSFEDALAYALEERWPGPPRW